MSNKGKPIVSVRLDGRDKLPSQNPLNAKLKAAAKPLPRKAPEPSQADLDRYSRSQGMEAREAAMMKGFKDTTRMQYAKGGCVGGSKGAAKVSKVMSDFKRGSK